jgi:hypothetical protein
MALDDFWINVLRTAEWRVLGSAVDSPRLDQERIKTILQSSTAWLTPQSVEGYDERDFDFLSDEERRQLTQSVQQFRAVVGQVSSNGPPADDLIRQAIPAFAIIVELIAPDRYEDPDALRIGKRIERQVAGKLPPWVRELVFATGLSANGDPSIWIWVEADDSVVPDQVIYDTMDEIREILRKATKQIGEGRWAYIRLRASSEQRGEEPPVQKRVKAKK